MQKKLPKVFLFIDDFNINNLSLLNSNIDIIYRNYKKKVSKSTLLSLKKFCKKTNRKLYISNNIKLATQLNLDGIYIPSFNRQINYTKLFNYSKLEVIGSAHSKQEIQIKKLQQCKLIFLSPLFKVSKKKNFLDIIKFNLIALNENKKFIALGGVNEKNINRVYLTNSIGFAGISWIKKNGPRRNLRPFL
mgnify:FL=1|tara:strand:- start:6862 stop:7431 length:570 start_codon:yes stop_codon:yes gene_type:complete